jgi:hypothetical protein
LVKSDKGYGIYEMPHWLTRHIGLPFAMEIIITMCWCIWKERNAWIFKGEDPSVQHCQAIFKSDFALLMHRATLLRAQHMSQWLENNT